MGLRQYWQKRDFSRTPEPAGKPPPGRDDHAEPPGRSRLQGEGTPQPGLAGAPRAGERSFVIQKHAASHLHYDFRLELEGVLKSWSVPKGPSLDPTVKRLAMATEDHPIEYADFEGVIPKGEYGGGTVLLWDRGQWKPRGNPHEDYRRGKLSFELYGDKLRGGWTLVKTASRDRGRDNAWLLMKDSDDEARSTTTSSIVDERPESVETGRNIEQIAVDADRVWHSNRGEKKSDRVAAPSRRARAAAVPEVPGARPGPLPDIIRPELPTLVKQPPTGDRWLHEMKFDGYRIVSRLEDGRVRMHSRRGEDWTDRFGPIAEAIAALPVQRALLDGEVAVLVPDGTTSFSGLLEALSYGADERLVYFVFDLLHLDGRDLTAARLEDRKAALEQLLGERKSGPLRYSGHVIGAGDRFFQHACRLALEGAVSKLRDAPYREGRSRDWVKVKCLERQEFVIGGFTRPTASSRSGIGSLVLGVRDDEGELTYVGRVGTGFTDKTLSDLAARLKPLVIERSPFHNEVTGRARGKTVWVEPVLVADIDFSEWTSDGKLRHPTFRGIREDKSADEVVRERPAVRGGKVKTTSKSSVRPPEPGERSSAKQPKKSTPPPRPARSGEPTRPNAGYSRGGETAEVAGVKITHADRVVYPEQGITKLDLANFYVDIERWILPHLVGRPTTLVRCPDGLAGPCFYQKHRGYWAPDTLRRVKIQEKTKVGEYLVVDTLAALVGLVQIGILEVHTWNSTADRLEQPDRIVIDLDPDEELPFAEVMDAARVVRDRLEQDDLRSFVKTTGGKGLHVVAPLAPGPSWDECASWARELAEELAGSAPRRFVAVMTKAKRTGRVFIDWLRNVRGSTSVSAYSTRAKPLAPVSVPLAWRELNAKLTPDRFHVGNLRRRMDSLGEDPWSGYDKLRQRLPRRGS